MNLFPDEAKRRELFPVSQQEVFLAHAAVTAIPQFVADAVSDYTQRCAQTQQEFMDVLRSIKAARQTCAQFIGAHADEIALLGPTSLGLSLFANGIPWEAGDEVLCYHGDYPANVYPWIELRRRGVIVRYLEPAAPGEITPELVAAALTPKTRLVAIASCHFFTGYRPDLETIGTILHERGILFSVDAIQTLGAFPLDVEKAHIDFLSADAHKWMLGPLAIGIVYVKKEHFALLRPTLLGAWNVLSPNFITQEEIVFHPTAQRYEPGVLNISGIYGMKAAIDLVMGIGMDKVSARILGLKKHVVAGVRGLGFDIVSPAEGPNVSGITTFSHPKASMAKLFHLLEKNGIFASLRNDRAGKEYIRLSPHFYNTTGEIDRVLEVLKSGL